MKIKIVIFGAIICVFLCGLSFAQDRDRIYNEICTKGFEGYKRFLQEYGGNSKKDFWNYFNELIKNLYTEKKFSNILACSEFWQELRQDELFDYDGYARAEKKEIDMVFTRIQESYKVDLKDKIAHLQPIDMAAEETLIKARKYTVDKDFTRLVRSYVNNYEKIHSRIPPGKKEDLQVIQARLNDIYQGFNIDSEIKKKISNYLDLWNKYHQIEEGDTFYKKTAANRERKAKLQEIKKITPNISTFNINSKILEIDKMIRGIEQAARQLQVHQKIEEIILAFERKKNPTIHELYTAKEQVIKASKGKSFEDSMLERVGLFREIPAQKQLNIDTLENYLASKKDIKNNVITVLKREFEKILLTSLDSLLNTGGKSLQDLRKMKITATKYKKYFMKETPWDNCTSLLEKYYQAKEDNNYPALLELYQGSPNIDTACATVLNKWNVMSQQLVRTNAVKYYQSQAEKVLGDKGSKSKPDFIKFTEFYNQIQEFQDNSLSGDWALRFNLLKKYFDAEKTDEAKAKIQVARVLHSRFPQLAKSYAIPKPELIAPTSVAEKIPPAAAISAGKHKKILDFLDTMFMFVKGGQFEPARQAMCMQLVNSDLNASEFAYIKREYRDKIPNDYDFLMNRFFHVINIREERWVEKAGHIIEAGDWPDDIKNRMKGVLNQVRLMI